MVSFLPILLFEIIRSRRVRDQVSKEAAASPQCLWMSKTALQSTILSNFWAPSWHKFFLIHNSSVSIRRTASRVTFTSSAIILTVNLRLDRTSSRTHAVLSLVCVADGRPLRCSSSMMFLPSENTLCQRKACALDIASSPKAC